MRGFAIAIIFNNKGCFHNLTLVQIENYLHPINLFRVRADTKIVLIFIFTNLFDLSKTFCYPPN